ncbi:MAG: VTC domain-containing protein [Anaerolineae bacterium]|jgi:SPX domain protein involved in polyphosphate accumulation|nr:VTC domain-containing protein [Anaerolineae bacterium]MBT7074111.1 VTC domain-containing protein [Anaerolineae bacterium]
MEEKLRYEIKMVFNALRLDEVRSWVYSHSAAFRVPYPPRQVNNIYFDTLERDLMMNHLDGVAERAKVRFRWYGENWVTKGGQIETKIKKSRLGYKNTQKVSETIDISQASWTEILELLKRDSSENFVFLLENLTPVLINQYKREYYESMDGLIRVTLDYDMHAFEQPFGFSPNTSFQQTQLNNVIIEMKSAKNNHKEIADALAEFPLYCTQNSKYLNGMEYAI